jgi:signal transduction histidine kinase
MRLNRWWQSGIVILLVAGLVFGGLGWATSEALRLEKHQREAAAAADRTEKMWRALYRLDGRVSPLITREDGRPYAQYHAFTAPVPALTCNGNIMRPGFIRVPSPLLDAELPAWMMLHFQFHPDTKWQSPQVLTDDVIKRLRQPPFNLTMANATPRRAMLLDDLERRYPPEMLMDLARQRGLLSPPSEQSPTDVNNAMGAGWLGQTENNYSQRGQAYRDGNPPQQQAIDMEQVRRGSVINRTRAEAKGNKEFNNEVDIDAQLMTNTLTGTVVAVRLGPMTPLWLPSAENPEHLLLVRLAQVGKKEVIQGVQLDWKTLESELTDTISDLFPSAKLLPIPDGQPEYPDRVMISLPLQLHPGPDAPLPSAGWTTLRIGLGLAWAAATVALFAVVLGGWTLLDLSERRMRFVSAVTHELRTPLTTLRLYLDMLGCGMVRDDKQKEEYLATLQTESERLQRLVNNVLDYARLERQSSRPDLGPVPLAALLEQVRQAWHDRCHGAGKNLLVESNLNASARLHTDGPLVQQILGNLIDNACKYSKEATDHRVWLRAMFAGPGMIAIEVEDCGPGVSPRERRSIFRPFRRGKCADTSAGGVGLGLALAVRWTGLLGGRLEVANGASGGACFRLVLPAIPAPDSA